MVDAILQYLNSDEQSTEVGFNILKDVLTFDNHEPITRCIKTISLIFIPLINSNRKRFNYIIEPDCIFNSIFGKNECDYHNITTSSNQSIINIRYSLRNMDQDTRNFLYSINRCDEYIIKYISDNSENIFSKKLSIEECEKHYISFIQYSEKYPPTINFDILPNDLINLTVINSENNEVHSLTDKNKILSKRISNFKLEIEIQGVYIENVEDIEKFICRIKYKLVKVMEEVNPLDKFSIPSLSDSGDK